MLNTELVYMNQIKMTKNRFQTIAGPVVCIGGLDDTTELVSIGGCLVCERKGSVEEYMVPNKNEKHNTCKRCGAMTIIRW